MSLYNSSNPHIPKKRNREQGIALVSIIFVTTVILILSFTLSSLAISERRGAATRQITNNAIYAADAASERARRQLVDEFNSSNLTIWNFLESADPDDPQIKALEGVHTEAISEDFTTRWEIVAVAEEDSGFGNHAWIDVAATAENGRVSQTVVRRIGFGAENTFNLAMLSETTDCMFCHLRVNGDVGNLVSMRPGWGDELGGNRPPQGWESGWCSGGAEGGSRINGNVYAARDTTRDCTGNGNKLNGATVTGTIEANSKNIALPKDQDDDGIPDFPPIKRDTARKNALGTISGAAEIKVVPLGGSYASAQSKSSASKVIEGNMIVIGTEADPIVLDGDIFVTGDVVIKGVVRGQGAIYSGRNTYVAGDIIMETPPYYVEGNKCIDAEGDTILTKAQLEAGLLNPNESYSDVCARKAVDDDTDSLRIGARGSIISGDYTEYADDPTNTILDSVDRRQSADFYKSQFDFQSDDTHYYDSTNGDELRCVNDVCKNAEQKIIQTKVSATKDAYSYSFRPGQVTSGGFKSWLSDAQYNELLKSDNPENDSFEYNSWRWNFGRDDWSPICTGKKRKGKCKDEIENPAKTAAKAELIRAGFSVESAQEAVDTRDRGSREYVGKDDKDNPIRYHWDDQGSLRVMMEGERSYKGQVRRIDAFLYANQRIAGKTSMQAMSITGGLIAKDLGILAPGRIAAWPFADNYDLDNNRGSNCSDPNKSEFYVYRSEDCALTVNYDHRLRNGGYGFNIVAGQIGLTLNWYLADSKELRVE